MDGIKRNLTATRGDQAYARLVCPDQTQHPELNVDHKFAPKAQRKPFSDCLDLNYGRYRHSTRTRD